MSITTKEIAEMVGVSRQAVSAVLNGKPGKVSAEKRRKIFHIAKNLQWRPNPAALRLAGHENNPFIGIDTGFFPPYRQSLLVHLTELLAESGYQVRLTPPGDKQHKLRVMYDFASEGAAGIITDINPELFDWKDFPVPLVTIGNPERLCNIAFDYAGGVQKMVSHLNEVHGHRKMAFVCQSRKGLDSGCAQSQAFAAALQESGLPCQPEQIVETTWNETAFDRILELFRKQHVTAFLCEQDALAARLIADFRRAGIRCPEDAAVTGSGVSFISELTPVPLTSIYLPVHEHAVNTVRLMIGKIKNHDHSMPDRPCLTPVGIFYGGSCGCPPADIPPLYWEEIPQALEDQFCEIRKSGRYELFRKYLEFDPKNQSCHGLSNQNTNPRRK